MPYSGVARFIIHGRLAGLVQTRSMFTGDVVLTGTDTDMTVMGGYFNALFAPIQPYISTLWVQEQFEIQHHVPPDWITMSITTLTGHGTGGGDIVPNLVAAVLVGKVVGKRLIGRKFWSGIIESATDANSLTVAALAAFASAAALYVTPYTSPAGSIFTPGILDKQGAFHAFSSGVVSSLLGTMRRRKPGLGI